MSEKQYHPGNLPDFDLSKVEDMVGVAKFQKELWVVSSDRGDIPPTLVAERDGKVLTMVVAPQIDKMLGVKAADICRAGMDADVITMFLDAHMASEPIGTTPEEFRKKYPPGSMQKMCDEEGACESGKITDVIICHRVYKSGRIQAAMIPYSYHGKGTKFIWRDKDVFTKAIDTDLPGQQMEGNIPRILREIMGRKSLKDAGIIGLVKNISEKQAQWHADRATMTALHSFDYIIVDYTSPNRPEE